MRNANCFFALIVLFFVIAQSSAQVIKVTLLGTGVPLPSIERFGPSTLVEANGQNFLFDCGRGVTQRLWQQKIQLGKINNLFLTHLHSDHTVGIADLWLTGLLPTPFGRRNSPFQVWGPSGTAEMMQGLKAAYQWDTDIRSREASRADSGITIKTFTITEGIVYDQNGVKITAFLVDHSDLIDSALGYRLEYQGRSVVISGDTRYSENLIKNAKGTDVLIHEVAFAKEELKQKSAMARQILGYHTSPEEAGKVFSLVNPRLAVYSHVVLLDLDPAIPSPTVEDILQRTRKNYAGRFEVGADLMQIDIGDTVTVNRNEMPVP